MIVEIDYKILQGDNRETLKTLEDDSIDAIVTDPPYGLEFLGKAWDANTGELETYQECLRVLKPGGYILAFSAARTYHHLAMTLEQAGFEIRDQLMWLYSSGFPKAQDIGKAIQKRLGVEETKEFKHNHPRVGGDGDGTAWEANNKAGEIVCTSPEAKQWEGWKTALKPAHEPICMARKPMKLSIAKNAQKWGVGALNIDATRILSNNPPKRQVGYDYGATIGGADPLKRRAESPINHQYEPSEQGRFPSNVIGEVAEEYQKYFYCPKVSRKERHIGFETPPALFGDKQGAYDDNGQRYAVELDKRTGNVGNNHPTVKPVELMKYLIKLVTPPNGTVLDPFTGSGSTGMAAVELGHSFIGCELDENYVAIAKRRIEAWNKTDNNFKELFEVVN